MGRLAVVLGRVVRGMRVLGLGQRGGDDLMSAMLSDTLFVVSYHPFKMNMNMITMIRGVLQSCSRNHSLPSVSIDHTYPTLQHLCHAKIQKQPEKPSHVSSSSTCLNHQSNNQSNNQSINEGYPMHQTQNFCKIDHIAPITRKNIAIPKCKPSSLSEETHQQSLNSTEDKEIAQNSVGKVISAVSSPDSIRSTRRTSSYNHVS